MFNDGSSRKSCLSVICASGADDVSMVAGVLKTKTHFSQPYFAIIAIVFEFLLENCDQYKCIYFLLPPLKDNFDLR
jgi:hypothetical protein